MNQGRKYFANNVFLDTIFSKNHDHDFKSKVDDKLEEKIKEIGQGDAIQANDDFNIFTIVKSLNR